MSFERLVDGAIVPWFWMLGALSLRWGVLILAIAAWLRLRPPSSSAARHNLFLAGLIAGPLLPLAPALIVKRTVPRPVVARESAPPPVVRSKMIIEAAPPQDFVPETATPASPSPPPPPPPLPAPVPAAISRRDAAWIAVAVLWLLGAAWATLRLLVGFVMLNRLARATIPAGPDLLGEFERCVSEIGLRRRVGLALHRHAPSPLAIGGLRPLVVVPVDWPTLSESARRACLLHELSHLARRDDVVRLIREVVRIPFFFHPLVHWLAAGIDRESERVCDEAALSRGVDPRDFARLLLDFARKGGRVERRRALALPFFARENVLDRITHLMEDDMHPVSASLSRRRAIGFSLMVAALAVPIGGLRVVAVAEERAAPVAAESRSVRLIDSEGKPVAGAEVWARFVTDRFVEHPAILTRSEADGAVRLPPPTMKGKYKLAAMKEGYALNNLDWDPETDFDSSRHAFRRPSPFVAILEDAQGRPVAGARVRIEMVAHPVGNAVFIETYPRDCAEVPSFGRRLTTTTDSHGRMTFDSISAGAGLKLIVSVPGIGLARVVTPPPTPMRVADISELGVIVGPPGEPRHYRVVPAGKLVGRVESKIPGMSLAGLAVSYFGVEPKGGQTNWWSSTRTDERGNFEIDGLEEGTLALFVIPPEGAVWTQRATSKSEIRSGTTTTAALELVEGIEAVGQVLSEEGKPLRGVMVHTASSRVMQSVNQRIPTVTDASGTYRFRVPTGGTVSARLDRLQSVKTAREDELRRVSVPAGAKSVAIPPLVKRVRDGALIAPADGKPVAARVVTGAVVDHEKKPVAGARVMVWLEVPRDTVGRSFKLVSDEKGRFAFEVPDGRVFYRIVAAKEGLAIGSTLGARDPSMSNQIDPIVRLSARAPFEITLVDSNDRPVSGVEGRIEAVSWSSELDPNRRSLLGAPKNAEVDAKRSTPPGMLKTQALPPGARMFGTSVGYFPSEAVSDDRYKSMLTARSDAEGRLRFEAAPAGASLKLALSTPDGRSFRVEIADKIGPGEEALRMGFIPGDPAKKERRKLVPAARIAGRLTSRVPGVSVANRTISYQFSRKRSPMPKGNLNGQTRTDGEGRFAFESLEPGTVNVIPAVYDDEPATCRAAADLELTHGQTSEANLELIEGVTVEGKVESSDGTPIANAMVGAYGPHSPRSGAACRSATTDAKGTYRFRIPSGESYFYLMSQVPGHAHQPGRDGTAVVIPEGAKKFTVPAMKLTRNPDAQASTLKGNLIDKSSRPVSGARVVACFMSPDGMKRTVAETITGEDGRFSIDAPNAPIEYHIVACKAGLATASTLGYIDPKDAQSNRPHTLLLAPVEPFEVVLVDTEGRPVAGARARIVTTARQSETNSRPFVMKNGKAVRDDGPPPPDTRSFSVCFTYFPDEAVAPGMFGDRLSSTSDKDGKLRFEATSRDTWLKLAVDAPDGRPVLTRWSPRPATRPPEEIAGPVLEGFVPPKFGAGVKVTLVPAAAIVGRLTSKLPGVSVANRMVCYQSTTRGERGNLSGEVLTDADGRFRIDHLSPGKVNVVPVIPREEPMTCRAEAELVLESGKVVEANFELIEGVVVEGRVQSKDGKPVPDAEIGCHGPHRPHSGAMVSAAPTDAEGRFQLRVPSGEVYLYVMWAGEGFAQADGQYGRYVTAPEGTRRVEAPVFELDRLP